LSLVALVSGCSQETTFKTYDAPEVPSKVEIAFIGNSLTLHPPKNDIGWELNNGMAASNKNNDYAHKLLAALKINEEDSYIRNFYPFESEPSVAKNHISSLQNVIKKRPKIVIVQLGENVTLSVRHPFDSIVQISSFPKNYSDLIATLKNDSDKVYCVSTFWESRLKDYFIKKGCEESGGVYVYIGDIYKDTNNADTKRIDYAHKGVDAHPKDWGMNQISLRLQEAILKSTLTQ
jgi:hypothetical protein